MNPLVPYRIFPCGDHAITIELGNKVTESINRQIISLFKSISLQPIQGIKDIIPAYNSLTIIYDVVIIKKNDQVNTAYGYMEKYLDSAFVKSTTANQETPKQIVIPVCYDFSLAPDINSLATLHQISVEEVIRLHSSIKYRVYMIGFLPGFAYLGTVDEKLITSRKATPRVFVPAGTVGIAGEQTGIYPFDSPGGWQLIGQTPLSMFSVEKEVPCLLQPGDEVQFYPISISEFENFKKS